VAALRGSSSIALLTGAAVVCAARSSPRACVMADEGPGVEGAGEGIDFSKKHPLEHTWTLWFDNPNGRQKPTTFGKTLRPVYTFNTVEDFWW
jgi:Eukaryotic initiation factor 4E